MHSLDFSMGRRAATMVGTIALAATAACSDDATAPKPAATNPSASSAIDGGSTILTDRPPVVDGVLTPGEYVGGAKFSIPVRIPGDILGFGSTGAVYVTHDRTYLYMAVVFDRKSSFRSNDLVGFEFDLDNDGDSEDGDDVMGMHAFSPDAWDAYRTENAKHTTIDVVDGGTDDAGGAFGFNGTKGVFEFRKELNSGDSLHDFGINTVLGAVKLGMRTVIALEAGRPGSGTMVWSFEPGHTTYCDLMVGSTFTSVSCP